MQIKGIKRWISLFCTTILFVGALAGCQSASGLKLNMKKGEKYRVVVTNENKITVEVFGSKTSSERTMKISYLFGVKDVGLDGTTTIDIKYDAISSKISNGYMTDEFDTSKSANSGNDQALGNYSGIAGQVITIKVGRDGKVQEVVGADKLLEIAAGKLNPALPNIKDSLLENLKLVFGEEALKQYFGAMTEMYVGNKEIKAGESWETKQVKLGSYPMNLTTKWTAKSVEGDVVSIDFNSDISVDNSSSPRELMGVKIKDNYKGTQSGRMKLSKTNGFIQSGEVNQIITGTMTSEPSSSPSNVMTTPSTMENRITYEVTKQ